MIDELTELLDRANGRYTVTHSDHARQVAARRAYAHLASVAGDLWNELCILGHDGNPHASDHPPYPDTGWGQCQACWWVREYERRHDWFRMQMTLLFPTPNHRQHQD